MMNDSIDFLKSRGNETNLLDDQYNILIEKFLNLFECDFVRIIYPLKTYFLLIGTKKNTKIERKKGLSGQWYESKNGKTKAVDFNFMEEKCIASGKTIEKLIASAEEYKLISKMSWEEYFRYIIDKKNNEIKK